MAFEVNNFKPTLHPQPMHYFAEKLSDYFKRKNKELDELKTERDKERKEKLVAFSELHKVIRLQERREQGLLQRFCLVLNEKKGRIGEMRGLLKEAQELIA